VSPGAGAASTYIVPTAADVCTRSLPAGWLAHAPLLQLAVSAHPPVGVHRKPVCGACVQPRAAMQLSDVQTLPSLQCDHSLPPHLPTLAQPHALRADSCDRRCSLVLAGADHFAAGQLDALPVGV